MIKAGRPLSWIFDEGHFSSSPTHEQIKEWKNIWWRVALSWIPPRDSRFDYGREMGCNLIDNVFNKCPLGITKNKSGGQHLMFVFPERHLSTQEEYQFLDAIKTHPEIQSAIMNVIEIVTKSSFNNWKFIKG